MNNSATTMPKSGAIRRIAAFAATLMVGLVSVTGLQAAVKETDWCKIETPDSAEPGKPIVVSVTLKEGATAGGKKLSSHLHWMTETGWGGMLSWKEPVDAEDGKTYTFTHSPALKGDMKSVSALVYLSPDGEFNNKTKGDTGENIPIGAPTVAASTATAASSTPAAASVAANTLKKETDWCIIETPEFAEPGKPISVVVTLKTGAAAAGKKLSNHLHWMKAEGWGGMLSWKEAVDAEDGKTYTFTHTPSLNADMKSVSAIVFLSPDGDFNSKTKSEAGENIKIGAPKASAPTAAAAASTPAAASVAANTLKKETDWCIIETPEFAEPGKPISVVVTLKTGAAAAGKKLSNHLHWMKAEGWGGMLSWKEAVDAEDGKTYTFTHTPSLNADMKSVSAIVFLSPDGDFNSKTKSEAGENIKIGAPKAPTVVSLKAAAGSVQKETDWCIVETPAVAEFGKPIVVRVTLKAGATAMGKKISNHLHWMKEEGWGGTLSWKPPMDSEDGKTFTFTHTPTLDEKMKAVSALVYLSPDGDYGTKTKETTGESILVQLDPDAVAAAKAEEERLRRPATATLKKSWMRIVTPENPIGKGEEFTVAVEYYLDASDNWADGTSLQLMPLGPWIDNPDGTYTTGRHHIGIPGLGTRSEKIAPGAGVKEFKFTISGTHRYNDILWMATFIGGDGKGWPWHIRKAGPRINRFVDKFDLLVAAEGGLFTYGEKPRIDIVWGEHPSAGSAANVSFRILNVEGRTVAEFGQQVTVGARGGKTPVALPTINERGVMLVTATIGSDTRDAFFGTIPDMAEARSKAGVGANAETPFGVTNVDEPDLARVARKIGMTYCRLFREWKLFEPKQGQWDFSEVDAAVKANTDAGLKPWICVYSAPPWAMPVGVDSVGFEPFPFDAAAWGATATKLAERYRSSVWGFEWLNEIVPGDKSPNPVADYTEFCRIGTAAVRSKAPGLKVQLAGGLWPRNFRTDLLKNGAGEYVDIMSIHYGNETGIRDALQDAASYGLQDKVAVWDNETASGLSTWGMPADVNLTKSIVQSKWVMRRWPAELTAGAKGITYFGGHTAAAGNWTFFHDPTTPRPVAATLAVLSSKIGFAKPLGTAYVGPDAVLHIFEVNGKGIAVAGTVSDADGQSARIAVPAGVASIELTDNQGNARQIATQAGTLSVDVGTMPVFLDGFNLATLAAQVGVVVGTGAPAPKPTLTVVKGTDNAVIEMRVINPLAQAVKGSVLASLASGYTFPAEEFSLNPGESRLISMPVSAEAVPAGTSQSMDGTVRMTWTAPTSVAVDKPFRLLVMDPSQLGNLLKNGGIEQADGTRPALWSGDAEVYSLSALGTGPGFDGSAARFTGAKSEGYQHINQNVSLPSPGSKYLYTTWVWNNDMQAGSNLSLDGKTFYIPSVFDAGHNTPFWRLMTHVRETANDSKTMGLTPVVKGTGWAMYDNVRVTIYEGTEYAAEAAKSKSAVTIDGKLDDWDMATDPIPLLCDNQLSAPAGYSWTPQNLAGVAKFKWDESALYFAAKVRDDKHVATTTGDDTIKGDSIVLAMHPGNRVEGADARAFAWYISSAVPGGGSGVHTLYRPASLSGGLSSGQLAKDSSLYDISIKREGDITVYEVRIPWSETGGLVPSIGVKAGLSLQLRDADGAGEPASMTWGGGLRPSWGPAGFGVITLVD